MSFFYSFTTNRASYYSKVALAFNQKDLLRAKFHVPANAYVKFYFQAKENLDTGIFASHVTYLLYLEISYTRII